MVACAASPRLPPMEALSVDEIPAGPEWQYEPKWDGFRCLVFRDGDTVELQSKSGKPLTRYFPELVEAVRGAEGQDASCSTARSSCRRARRSRSTRCCSASIRRQAACRSLSKETPALLIVFDLLADADGTCWSTNCCRRGASGWRPSRASISRKNGRIRLSPATTKLADAKKWLKRVGATLDGIIAKRRDLPYRSGDRTGMQKIKNYRSADCVVGGFRYNEGKPVVGSLLLGLYDDDGLLHHVGFTSIDQARGQAGADQEAREADRAAGLHRQRAGRPKPLVDQALGGVAAAQAEARRRGLLRPFHRRPLPPRHAAAALAAGQVAEAMHDGSGHAEEGGPDEAAEVKPVTPAACRSAPAPRRRDRASR